MSSEKHPGQEDLSKTLTWKSVHPENNCTDPAALRSGLFTRRSLTIAESLQTNSHRTVSSGEVTPFMSSIFNIWIRLDTREHARDHLSGFFVDLLSRSLNSARKMWFKCLILMDDFVGRIVLISLEVWSAVSQNVYMCAVIHQKKSKPPWGKFFKSSVISVFNDVFFFTIRGIIHYKQQHTHFHLKKKNHTQALGTACFHLLQPEATFGSLSKRERGSSKSWMWPGRRRDERARCMWTGEKTEG